MHERYGLEAAVRFSVVFLICFPFFLFHVFVFVLTTLVETFSHVSSLADAETGLGIAARFWRESARFGHTHGERGAD